MMKCSDSFKLFILKGSFNQAIPFCITTRDAELQQRVEPESDTVKFCDLLSHFPLCEGWLLRRVCSQKRKDSKIRLNAPKLTYTLSTKDSKFIKRQVVQYLGNSTDVGTQCSYPTSVQLRIWNKILVFCFLLGSV